MCLSKVYLKKIGADSLLMDEVLQVAEDKGTISVRTIFGEEKKLEGYRIGEVNLVENYVILRNTGGNNNA